MSFPTQPAFIHKGTWSPESRAHPALDFLEYYGGQVFDKQAWKTEHFSHWHTHDYTFTRPDGSVVSGGHEAWTDGHHSLYGDFSGHQHDPIFFVVWETQDGWELIGEGNVYADFAAGGDVGDKVKNRTGREWHTLMYGSFHFEFVRSEAGEKNKYGILIKSLRIFADSLPILGGKIKRGIVKKEDLEF